MIHMGPYADRTLTKKANKFLETRMLKMHGNKYGKFLGLQYRV